MANTDIDLWARRTPGIWLQRTEGAFCNSKLGGLPFLPNDLKWPRQLVYDERPPLHFLAQIDLSELPPTPLVGHASDIRLPKTGILYFFAEIDSELLWTDTGASEPAYSRVLFSEKIGSPSISPEDIGLIGDTYYSSMLDWITTFPEVPITACVIDSFWGFNSHFPSDVDKKIKWRIAQSIEEATGAALPTIRSDQLNKTKPFEKAFSPSAWFYQRVEWGGKLHPEREPHIAHHQMLGAPAKIQNAADIAFENDFVLLLQIDTDFGVHRQFKFCDDGMIQFWIRYEDLIARRFDKAWATTEG